MDPSLRRADTSEPWRPSNDLVSPPDIQQRPRPGLGLRLPPPTPWSNVQRIEAAEKKVEVLQGKIRQLSEAHSQLRGEHSEAQHENARLAARVQQLEEQQSKHAHEWNPISNGCSKAAALSSGFGADLPPDICTKVTSFNVLGWGFCAMPGPNLQWSHFAGLMDRLLQQRDANSGEISFIGLQEDVFVLKAGQTWPHHTDSKTHVKFERLSFMDDIFAKHGFKLVAHSVHDGLSTSSHMLIKDPEGGQLKALEAEHHRKLFTESQGDRKCTKSECIKLGNSMWIKIGPNLQSLAVNGETVTFDTWKEAESRGLVEYKMVPSRSAAKVTVQKAGVDILMASTCHLAGGKFDDRWLLTDDSLVNINDLMLTHFAGSALASRNEIPALLFGDTNMKHYKYIDDGVYDPVILQMLFGTKDKKEIKQLSAAYEGHRKFLMREGDGEKVSDNEVACLEAVGKHAAELAKVFDIEVPGSSGEIDPQAVETLFQRVKKLWRISDLRNMQLIKPSSDKAASCLFGGVIDHVFFKGLTLRNGSYKVDEGNEQAMVQSSPDHKSPLDRIRASDHFPVMADFTLHLENTR